jgi:hypothetical protein
MGFNVTFVINKYEPNTKRSNWSVHLWLCLNKVTSYWWWGLPRTKDHFTTQNCTCSGKHSTKELKLVSARRVSIMENLRSEIHALAKANSMVSFNTLKRSCSSMVCKREWLQRIACHRSGVYSTWSPVSFSTVRNKSQQTHRTENSCEYCDMKSCCRTAKQNIVKMTDCMVCVKQNVCAYRYKVSHFENSLI